LNIDKRKQTQRVLLFFAAILLLVKLVRNQNPDLLMNEVSGLTMGTIAYNVKYKTLEPIDYKMQIDSVLKKFNQSLSTYIPESEISKLNKSGSLVFQDPVFYPVLLASKKVHLATKGAFDPTIGPLINAYGFGPDKASKTLNQHVIDSLLHFVGFSKINFNPSLITIPNGTYLDLSAVAKGYAVDLITNYLKSKNIENAMVEIGGEVRTFGTNDSGETWRIGIQDPLIESEEYQPPFAVVNLKDRSIATSGNYRNFYRIDDKTYAHIIDPRTGKMSKKNILSASVFAPNCMLADAYATAFMVLGVEASMEILKVDDRLDALLIYQGEEGPEHIITDGVKAEIIINHSENP
jgi:thiamine biosynthesis lipoprotein